MRLLAVLAIAGTALLATGCGGGESSSAAWANDFCESIDGWRENIEQAAEGLANPTELNEEELDEAVQDAVSATDELLQELGELGPPETEASQQIQSELNDLEAVLRSRANNARKALDQPAESVSDALARLSALAKEFSAAAGAVETAVNDIRELDPAGELREALEDSEACQNLRGQDE
jgi:hypothetical protein